MEFFRWEDKKIQIFTFFKSLNFSIPPDLQILEFLNNVIFKHVLRVIYKVLLELKLYLTVREIIIYTYLKNYIIIFKK